MLPGDFSASRDNPLVPVPSGAPPLAGVPERLFVPALPEARRSRLGRLVPSTLLSLVVHVALTAAVVIFWRAMIDDLTAKDAIPVEIVHSIPGEKPPEKKPEAPHAEAKPPQPENKADPLAEALPPPAGGPPPPPAGPEPQPQPQEQAKPEPPESAKPPAKGSSLVERPPEPKQAIVKPDETEKPNAAQDETQKPAPPPPAAQAPEILSSPQSDSKAPAPSKEPAADKPAQEPDPNTQSRADPSARLAATLPMGSIGLPSTFRAMLSSGGQSTSQEYKGVVYGVLARAQQVAEQARQRGLKGLVVLGLTLTESGAIEKVGVVQSSGHPDVDAFALDFVRKAAPFPAPPPGTSRSFTPAISFGDNQN